MDPLLLVLDIDETLVFATETPLDREADFVVGPYRAYKRPHVDAFIASVLDRYRVAVWTSATPEYAAVVVPELFGEAPLEFVWDVTRCTRAYDPEWMEHRPVKNLKKLRKRGYDLERVLVVDDTPGKHVRNYGNLVRVSEFTGDPRDDELPALLRYLQTIEDVDNVRSIEKRGWRQRVDASWRSRQTSFSGRAWPAARSLM